MADTELPFCYKLFPKCFSATYILLPIKFYSAYKQHTDVHELLYTTMKVRGSSLAFQHCLRVV